MISAFLNDTNRRTMRAPVNPLDKSTIVSIFPKVIEEIKHTIQPGKFRIESGTYEKPSSLIVGPSSWWKELDPEQPLLEIPVSSIQIADSVVKDYCNGLIACDMGNVMPGLFFIPGEFTIDYIKKNYKSALDSANIKQRNWYQALVKMGDILWARSNGNPLSISDDMRLAARELHLDSKEWLKDYQAMEMINCKACGTRINSSIIVCPNCKVILDQEKFKSLNLAFAN